MTPELLREKIEHQKTKLVLVETQFALLQFTRAGHQATLRQLEAQLQAVENPQEQTQ